MSSWWKKESHASTWAKGIVLLAMANKWEGEVIEKEENFSKAKDKLNQNSRHFKELKEAQKRFEVEVEAYRHQLAYIEDKICLWLRKGKA